MLVRFKGDAAVEVMPAVRIAAMSDAVINAHRPLPNTRHGRDARADAVHLLWRLAAHPGAVSVFVDAGLVSDFQVVEAIARMRQTVVAVGVRQEVQLADIGAAIAILPQADAAA